MKDSRPKFAGRTVDGVRYARTWYRGRWHSLGPYDSPDSYAKYETILREWERDQQTRSDARALTVGAFVIRYLEYAESRYRKHGKPTSEVANVRTMLRWMVKLFRRVPVRDLHAGHVHDLQAAMVASGRYTRRTINQHVGRMRRAVRWAVGLRLVPPDVVTSLQCAEPLRRGQVDTPEPVDVPPAPVADVEAVLPHLPRGVQGAIRFQLHTGCRPGEALIARECDIDSEGEVWSYTPATHKTEHHGGDRVVMIGPRGRAVVTEFLGGDPTDHLFVTATGRPYTRSGYRTQIRRTCERIGVPPWNPNQLRHTFATEIERRYGIEGGQAVLGHSDERTTRIYVARDLAKAASIVQAIG